MFERLKRTLVQSYIGAIALGYLLAQCVIHFANAFAWPLDVWVTRRIFPTILQHSSGVSSPWQYSGTELLRFVIILLAWYALIRWLYFKPLKNDILEPTSDQVQTT